MGPMMFATVDGCVNVVDLARDAPGCLDFAITPDGLDPGRIDIFERWDSRPTAEAFRGSGPSDEQAATVLSASVSEYDVAGSRSLT